jgi:hypothetical protein
MGRQEIRFTPSGNEQRWIGEAPTEWAEATLMTAAAVRLALRGPGHDGIAL